MVIELGSIQIDFGGASEKEVEASDCDMSDYTVPLSYRDPPPGYEQRLSTDGATEIVFPPVPVWRALLQALVCLVLLAWMCFLIEAGKGMFSVIFALIVAYSLVRLAVQCSTRTSLVVSDHRILRRRSLAGGRHKLESTEAGVTEANKTGELWWKRVSALELYRVAPEPGRPPIAADVLHLGQFLACHANVPLAVVVRRVPEPNYGD